MITKGYERTNYGWAPAVQVGDVYDVRGTRLVVVRRVAAKRGRRIISAEAFFTEKPETEWQRKREAKAARRDRARSEWCARVLACIGAEPKPLKELARECGEHPGAVHQRLCYWDEFADVEKVEAGWRRKPK